MSKEIYRKLLIDLILKLLNFIMVAPNLRLDKH